MAPIALAFTPCAKVPLMPVAVVLFPKANEKSPEAKAPWWSTLKAEPMAKLALPVATMLLPVPE